MAHLIKGPQRIVCLTEETTETLYLLGEDHRIVILQPGPAALTDGLAQLHRLIAATAQAMDRR